MRFFYILLPFALFTAFSAQAEYRVYLLSITDTTTGQTRQLTSTLDDIQYRGYFPVKATEQLVLTDTWMCWGRQGDFIDLCRNPHVGAAAGAVPRAPSSTAPTASSTRPRTTP